MSMANRDLRLEHLALVVPDLDEALRFWQGQLGLRPAGERQSIDEEGVDVAFLQLGEARLELVQPTDDSAGVARYLAKSGVGMHHFCLETPDLDTMLRELKAQGIQLIDEEPRERGGRRCAFVHPGSAGGVLLELYERA